MHISEKHNCNKPTRPIINIQSAMNSKQNLTIIASVNMTGDKTKAVILKRNIENVSAIFQHKKQKTLISYSLTRVYLLFLVPRPGVEPGWKWIHWCLRPARLPIPPSGLLSYLRCKGIYFSHTFQMFFGFSLKKLFKAFRFTASLWYFYHF